MQTTTPGNPGSQARERHQTIILMQKLPHAQLAVILSTLSLCGVLTTAEQVPDPISRHQIGDLDRSSTRGRLYELMKNTRGSSATEGFDLLVASTRKNNRMHDILAQISSF